MTLAATGPGDLLIASPDPEHAGPRRVRAFLLEDDDIDRWASRLSASRPQARPPLDSL